MFDNSWRSSTRRCPLGRCPMDDGKFSSYRAERGRAVREGSLRVRRGDLRERHRTTRLPAPSARGSAEAPRVPPTAATRAAGRGLLHPELTAVQDLAGRREHFAKPLRRCGKREPADEQLLRHGAPPLLLPRCEFMHAPEKRGRWSRGLTRRRVPVNRFPGQTTPILPNIIYEINGI